MKKTYKMSQNGKITPLCGCAKPVASLRPNFCGGFTLIEILVGVIIGLLGTLIIFQVFAVSEGQKRTTTAGGDAQQNGAFSLYALEHDIRNAGGGISGIDARA